jgi:hypothetical protein
MKDKQLVYIRGAGEWGIAIYDYERCELITEFSTDDQDECQRKWDEAEQYIEDHDMQIVDY